MAKREERRKAIKLRKQGKTYVEIRKDIGVSKSTLSRWLNGYLLTKEQANKLEKSKAGRRLLGVEKTRIIKAKKRQKRLNKTYKREMNLLLPLSERELYLCGLFLYWGEGVKGIKYSISLNNTDPKVVQFYYHWLVKSLKIPKEKIRVALHLYEDMDISRELKYWSKELGIPRNQFNKPYIKTTKRQNVDHKGFGHGTCGLYLCNTRLKEKISFGIKAIADHYSGVESDLLV